MRFLAFCSALLVLATSDTMAQEGKPAPEAPVARESPAGDQDPAPRGDSLPQESVPLNPTAEPAPADAPDLAPQARTGPPAGAHPEAPAADSAAGPRDGDARFAYSDPSGFLSLRLPKGWGAWEPERVTAVRGIGGSWPQTTSIFSLTRAADDKSSACPCVWVARFDVSPDRAFLDAVEERAYPEAPFERVIAPQRVPPFAGNAARYFHDPARKAVWGWQDQRAADGSLTRIAIVYVPTARGTAVLMFQGKPALFDAQVPTFAAILDSLQVQSTALPDASEGEPGSDSLQFAPARGSPARTAPAAWQSSPDPLETPLLVRSLAVLMAVLLAVAGVYGWRVNGVLFAARCMLLVVITSVVFMGNFVIDVRRPAHVSPPLHEGHAIARGIAAAFCLPIAFAALAKWRKSNLSFTTNAWIVGSLLALFALFARLVPT